MKLFLDTADIEQIREAYGWGIVDGVTTNPTHVSKTGRSPRELYREICRTVDGPVSLETIGLETDQMVTEARDLATIADNVVVKVPVTRNGLKAVKQLASEGIKTNVTVTFSALQALLAAKCGATYISPFVGRLDAVGHVGMDLVRQIRTIYDHYDYPTQIIVAAVRHPVHVLEAALAGADVCTMFFDVMKQLYDHPLTDVGIEMFLNDWRKVPQDAEP
jgi:transaldolase